MRLSNFYEQNLIPNWGIIVNYLSRPIPLPQTKHSMK